jgi:hypothetical protein
MEHQFFYPQVSEVRFVDSRVTTPAVRRASQRALVEASLLRVPPLTEPYAASAKQ